YHLFQRFWSSQTVPNLGNLQVRPNVQVRSQAWFGDWSGNTDQLYDAYGAYTVAIAASSTWTVADTGQIVLPPVALGALADPTKNFLTPHGQWADSTAGGSTLRSGWAALLPVDGSLLVGVLNNPANAPFGLSAQWLWAYLDGTLTNRAGAGDGPAWGYSVEGVNGQANPARSAGGAGTQNTGSINLNLGADPYLVLDPSIVVAQTGQAGVNQLVCSVADGVGAVLGVVAEITYTPLYLWPR
ncbi:MAG: hypothetical protein ACHQ4H_09935, partial [Ktedonobacterales bacterium]